MSISLEFLLERLELAASGLPGVEKKRLFGCDAVFRDGRIFGLVWKEGRIGLKFPDQARFESRHAERGVDLWSPMGKKGMSGWLLVPESFHDDEDLLREWTKESHALAAEPIPAKKNAVKSRSPSSATKTKRPAKPAKKVEVGAPAKRPKKVASTKVRRG
jgi:TfoX/Sxy family transcriptional regulator of competence genes